MRRGTARLGTAVVAACAAQALLLSSSPAGALDLDASPVAVAVGIPLQVRPAESDPPARCSLTVSTPRIENVGTQPNTNEQWVAEVVSECSENDKIFIDLRTEIHAYTDSTSAGIDSGPDTDGTGYSRVIEHPTYPAYDVPQGGGVRAIAHVIYTYPFDLDKSANAGTNCHYVSGTNRQIDCRAASEYVPNPHPGLA